MSNAPSKPVSFSRPKVGYFSNRPRKYEIKNILLYYKNLWRDFRKILTRLLVSVSNTLVCHRRSCVADTGNGYKILEWILKGKKSGGKPRRGWEVMLN